jgi:hypothetical protein
MGKTNWTEEEMNYIEDNWGTASIPTIAKKLNKTINAIKLKANRMGLGCHLYGSELITFNQLLGALNKHGSYTWQRDLWTKKGLKVSYKKSINKKYLMVNIKDFWKWVEKNRKYVDFSKVEENILGPEPEWVKVQRKADQLKSKFKKTPWTPAEDCLLKSMLKSYKYTYKDISQRLLRTEGAIKRRMLDLRINERPLIADKHSQWSNEDTVKLMDLKSKGYSSEIIAEIIGTKTALAINAKLERLEKENKKAS